MQNIKTILSAGSDDDAILQKGRFFHNQKNKII